MYKLNFPEYEFRIGKSDGKLKIFDAFRKKMVALTPEEWVRQHVLHFLKDEKKIPSSLIAVEKEITYNQLKKRFDILVFNASAKPVLMVECKAPDVEILQDVFNQIAVYNTNFKVNYLVVTNGMKHFCCKLNTATNKYDFIKDIPSYEELKNVC